MKSLTKTLLLLVALVTPLVASQALAQGVGSGSLKRFEASGTVSSVNSVELISRGKKYRYDSSMVFLDDSFKKSVGAIEEGDVVWMRGRIINSVPYIERILVEPADEN